jgi:hypothetical protein
MGTDVMLWTFADPDTEWLDGEADAFFRSRTNLADIWGNNGKVFEVYLVNGQPVVQVHTLARFYDGGKHGYWPPIYHGIRAMQELFPNNSIYYHGDTIGVWEMVEYGVLDNPGVLCGDERLSRYWQTHLMNDPYDGLEKDVAW